MRRCRKYLYAVLFACLLLSVFQIGASAEGSEEYTVRYADGEYTLSYLGEAIAGGETLSELFPLIAEGGTVTLEQITADSPLSLSTSVTLRGELTLRGGASLNITEGASVVLDGGRLCLPDGASVRIKEGSFTLSGGEIEAIGGSAVVMDYSSGAVFQMTGGALRGAADVPTLSLSLGTAIITGGVIENTRGCAVESHASLYLSGSPTLRGGSYDVVAKTPPSLSYRDEPFLSTVRVMHDGIFSEGRGYCLFYLANEEQASRIRVFDRNGAEYPLSYFPSASFCPEERFLGVGLPYTVRMMLGGEKYESQKVYLGDTASMPSPPERLGYTFRGWYTDTSFGDPYDFSAPVFQDTVLYGKAVLDAPTFALGSLTFTYDGEVHPLSLSELSHPLASVGYFSYEWYRDGELLADSSAALPIRNVSECGEYHLRLRFTLGNDSVTVTTPSVSVTVLPKTVEVPTVEDKAYTGSPLRADIYDDGIYRVLENEGGTEVGEYSVTLMLVDGENYRFQDTDEVTISLTFRITRAKNSWVSAPSIKDIYEGAVPSAVAHARFGTPKILYARGLDGPFSDLPPTAVGEYIAQISVADSENYEGIAPVYLTFSVLPVYATGLRITSAPLKSAYIAFERFDTEGIEAYVSYCDGSVRKIPSDALTVEYLTNTDSLAFGDTSVELVFEGTRASVSVSVERAAYVLEDFFLQDGEHIYNGEWTTLSPIGTLSVGADGHRLTYTVSGGGCEVGEYQITLSFHTESTQYITPEPLYATLSVIPREVLLVWSEEHFVYDGFTHAPTAVFTDVFGEAVTPSILGGAISAGEEYLAEAVSMGNYRYLNPKKAFRIEKATYDTTGVYWRVPSLVYDGEEKTVYIDGLPSGVVCTGYADNTGRDAGVYTAYATFSYDEVNYYAPRIDPFVFEILPAEFDMSGVSFPNMTFTYDGTVHTPILYGALPVGVDGSTLTVSFDRGVMHVAEGDVSVLVTFTPTSKNYRAPSPITVILSVTPCPIEVLWQVSEFVYNGEMHTPVATSEKCAIRVTGGGVVAGEYIAVATSGDPDFVLINPTCPFTVLKARNTLVEPLLVESVYESGRISPTARALYGRVEFRYYLDEGLTQPIDAPTLAGDYFVIACIEEYENYHAFVSAPCRFSIFPVFAIGISVGMTERPLYAFEKIEPSLYEAYLCYNDGNRVPIEDLGISYMHASSLRVADSAVTFTYGEFSLSVPVVVLKKPITPEIPALVYSGKRQFAASSPYYTVLTDEGGIHAGEYAVRLLLTDSENCCFSGAEGDVVEVTYRILPRPITVTFDGQSIYLDNKEVSVTWRITKGEVIDGDTLTVIPCVTERKIGGTVTHPDYEITVIEGELLRTNRLSAHGRENLLLLILLIIVVIMLLIILYMRRLELVKLFYRYRKRLRFAAMVTSASVPRQDGVGESAGEMLETTVSDEEPTPPPPTEDAPESEPSEEVNEEEAGEISQTEELVTEAQELLRIDTERADELITDSLAKDLIRSERITVITHGTRRTVVNVDTLGESFLSGEQVDVNALKERNVVPYDTGYVKILARGYLDKPLFVYANDFSLSAVKMIALSGGEAVRVRTVTKKRQTK